jgi:hypothetical protein
MSTKATHAGLALIETIWYAYANRIVDSAVRVYQLNKEQETEIKSKFLKRGDFVVEVAQPSQNKDEHDS